MRYIVVGSLVFSATLFGAADVQGDWIAEISAKGAETQYARVKLQVSGSSLTGTWNHLSVSGTAEGDHLKISLTRNGSSAGTLESTAQAAGFLGEGHMIVGGRGGAQQNRVTFKLSRPPSPPPAPRTLDYEPTVFYGYYSAANPPALRIFPGNTVRTRTYDASGRDNASSHARRQS